MKPTMWQKGKTILMKKADAKAWLKALRSGRYTKGKGTLRAKNKFCCLGVLEHALDGRVERRTLPSYKWLEKHGIHMRNDIHGYWKTGSNPAVCEYEDRSLASGVNDDTNASFKQIADFIEPCIQTY